MCLALGTLGDNYVLLQKISAAPNLQLSYAYDFSADSRVCRDLCRYDDTHTAGRDDADSTPSRHQ